MAIPGELKSVQEFKKWAMEYYKDAVDFDKEWNRMPMPLDLNEARRQAVKVAKDYGEANKENWDMRDSKIVYTLENLAQGNHEALSNNKIIYSYETAPIQQEELIRAQHSFDASTRGVTGKETKDDNIINEPKVEIIEEGDKEPREGKEVESSL